MAAVLSTAVGVPPASSQPLPEGEFYGDQTFSPTVEILVAAGNGLFAAYNGYLLVRGRRRHVAAGASVILGAIGIAIGLRDGANYPTTDLAFGTAAVVAGGSQMLLGYPLASPSTGLPERRRTSSFVAGPRLISVVGGLRAGVALHLSLAP